MIANMRDNKKKIAGQDVRMIRSMQISYKVTKNVRLNTENRLVITIQFVTLGNFVFNTVGDISSLPVSPNTCMLQW